MVVTRYTFSWIWKNGGVDGKVMVSDRVGRSTAFCLGLEMLGIVLR